MKTLQLLLFILTPMFCCSQSPTSKQNLREVIAGLESKFVGMRGTLDSSQLPTTVYFSNRTIEGTTNNQIVRFADTCYSYFATLLEAGTETEAKHLLAQWKEIIKGEVKGYTLKSEKLSKVVNTHLGYEFERTIGMQSILIDLCFYKMDEQKKYSAYISFTPTYGSLAQ